MKTERRYRASITVEAAVVCSTIILCMGALISHAYQTHDAVTGSMILEEVLVNARWGRENQEDALVSHAELYGEEIGNPRVWYGEYNIETEVGTERISGKALAGDWTKEIEMDRFQPGTVLRRYEAIREIGEELTNGGSGIQAGDESELHGNPAGDNRE